MSNSSDKHFDQKFMFAFFPPNHQGSEIDGDEWEMIDVFEQREDPDNGGDVSDRLSFASIYPLTPVKFTIVSKAEASRDLEDKIEIICSTFLLPRGEAIMLLHHFKWSVQRTQEEWLEREYTVRKAVGLFERPILQTCSDVGKSICGNCHENNPGDTMIAVSCGHCFCRSCLTGYISEAVNEGPKCLALQCPNSSCDASVGLHVVETLSTEDDKKKFDSYLLESYLISCKEVKSCPAPGCEYVFCSGGEVINYTSVTCRCLYTFCWTCSKEAHSPVDCCKADKWLSDISTQSENWIIANATPCPKCNLTLEIDSSYTYVDCPSCHYEFCRHCGDNWYGNTKETRSRDHECSLNESSRHRAEDEHMREKARKSLEKYSLCYDKWVIIESCRANALTGLKLFQEVQLVEISAILNVSSYEMDFLIKAYEQIVEGWQLLKWSYVYGYFLSEHEIAKMPLLEFTQEQCEDRVRFLNKQVEELTELIYNCASFGRVIHLRVNLVQLTWVTKGHLNRMEAALKAGLPEIESSLRSMANTRSMPSLNILQDKSVDGQP